MEEEKNILVFIDEDGEEIEMELVDTFLHDGENYALLAEIDDDECICEDDECEDDECECGVKELFIMKVVKNGDEEDFVPVDEDKMDELMDAVEELFSEED